MKKNVGQVPVRHTFFLSYSHLQTPQESARNFQRSLSSLCMSKSDSQQCHNPCPGLGCVLVYVFAKGFSPVRLLAISSSRLCLWIAPSQFGSDPQAVFPIPSFLACVWPAIMPDHLTSTWTGNNPTPFQLFFELHPATMIQKSIKHDENQVHKTINV